MSHTLGEGGSAKSWHSSISLFSKMGDEEGGRDQKSQNMGDIIYGRPQNNKFISQINITY